MGQITRSTWLLISCAKHSDSASASVARLIWKDKGYVNSATGENSKISPEALFNDNSNKETLNVNKTC